ncbi:unnamed protein product [Phytomonas sp. EM1]|nr:unnamed protein product [Phytomonas sp. EM1]|eukprot:CCW62030.1 unnamed protein product [Phytomonas sp. isolate EM1]
MSESFEVAEGEHRYSRVNVSKPREYWDYESLKVEWNSPDRYEVERRIGRGKYSNVFLGHDTELSRRVSIKVLKPVKKKKILRELKILQILKGCPNIVELYDTVRDPSSKVPSFVFEYIEASDFRTLFPHFSDLDVRNLIYQVLIALEYAHSRGIMHRDVKPNNVCIDYKQKKLRLIDWGLAEFYHPETSYNARVASRYFKGPELLIELPTYDYRLDMWSLGCMMAGIIFMKEPFFRGKDNTDQLVRIVKVLGTDDLRVYLNKFNLKLPSSLLNLLTKQTKKPWSLFVTPENRHLCPDTALDFLDKLLRYDHTERIQAAEALQHPYFDPVRPQMGSETGDLNHDNCEESEHN